MKLRLSQIDVTPGAPTANTQILLNAIDLAKQDGVDILVFSEMVIPGYLLGDEWERNSFLRDCEQCGERIRAASQGICIIFGNVAIDWQAKNEDGRVRKYNAVFVADDGEFVQHPRTHQSFFIKMLMPNYREFDDNRHFYDPRKLAYERQLPWEDMIQPAATRFGLLGCFLCEDGWDDDYNISPVALLSDAGSRLLINISSSPYTFNKNQKRIRVFSAQARRFGLPLIYVNNIGLQDNGKTLFTFDGASCAYRADGSIIGHIDAYQQNHLDVDPFSVAINAPLNFGQTEDSTAQQYQAIHYGVQKFMARMGIRKVVIGISGGIDSAVVAALFRQILAPENIFLVNMPGPFTSPTTIHLAHELAQKLDCPFATIPIQPAVDITTQQLRNAIFQRGEQEHRLVVSDFTLENIQARDRSARILAGVAACFGGAFTCNANKTEMTVGYSTLYGDLGGFLACIADLWKGEVYALAHYLNEHVYGTETIPTGTIKVVPSAELSAQQNVDAGQGDPLIYPYHDQLFKSWVERWNRATPEDNLRWYCDGTLAQELNFSGDIQTLFPDAQSFITDLERWWNLYQGMAIAKRIQAPPVLAIKRRAFGFDHREAQMGPRFSEGYFELKRNLLGQE
jgi:NAD+ synthase (glutamine-hydrolysing)